MTLGDTEPQNRVFNEFFGDFGLRDTFQKRIALKSIEIDTKKLRMKFSALNVNFDGPSLDFIGSRGSLRTRGHQRAVLHLTVFLFSVSLISFFF